MRLRGAEERLAAPPAVLSKKVCTGKPVVEGVGVCEGVCDCVRVSVLVTDRVAVGLGVCDAVGVGEQTCLSANSATAGYFTSAGAEVHDAPPLALVQRPYTLATPAAGRLRGAGLATPSQFTAADADSTRAYVVPCTLDVSSRSDGRVSVT